MEKKKRNINNEWRAGPIKHDFSRAMALVNAPETVGFSAFFLSTILIKYIDPGLKQYILDKARNRARNRQTKRSEKLIARI